MKIFWIGALCFAIAMAAQGQTQTAAAQGAATETKTSRQVLTQFFDRLGKKQQDQVLVLFADDAYILAVRKDKLAGFPVYGEYRGTAQVESWFESLAAVFDTKSFNVRKIVAEGNTAVAYGDFMHVLKSTGREFPSEWVLIIETENGKIKTYRFYEDSAKVVDAMQTRK